jgi:hypothetical protein
MKQEEQNTVTDEELQHASCILQKLQNTPTTPPKENKLKKLVRRVVQTIKPTHCFIRYNTMTQKWAVLDMTNPSSPVVLREFDFGYMINVKFKAQKVTSSSLCEYGTIIGTAEGDLIEGYFGPSGREDNIGYRNLMFDGTSFKNMEGQDITEAKRLRIMSGRQAVYRD